MTFEDYLSSYRESKTILGDRLAVGHRSLESVTQVRILVPQPWSHRLAVRTLASHAGNRGSIPRGTTMNSIKRLRVYRSPFFIPRIELPHTQQGFWLLGVLLAIAYTSPHKRLILEIIYCW